LQASWFVPHCEKERLKPVVAMSFDTLDEVEEFYKTYAHESGFSVHIGAQAKKSDGLKPEKAMRLRIRDLCVRGKVSRRVKLNQTSKRSTQRQDVDAMHVSM
jgi:hypothetical protein